LIELDVETGLEGEDPVSVCPSLEGCRESESVFASSSEEEEDKDEEEVEEECVRVTR
jgi:hypothetical protein